MWMIKLRYIWCITVVKRVLKQFIQLNMEKLAAKKIKLAAHISNNMRNDMKYKVTLFVFHLFIYASFKNKYEQILNSRIITWEMVSDHTL